METSQNFDYQEIAIMLTLLGENIATTLYYERVNPMIRLKESDVDHSIRLINIQTKIKKLIRSEHILDFIKRNPHLNELWPDIRLDDEIAKQQKEDSEAMAKLDHKIEVAKPGDLLKAIDDSK